MSVQFGLAVRNFVGPGEVPDVDGILTYGQRAEQLGFESLWVWDHILLGVEPRSEERRVGKECRL